MNTTIRLVSLLALAASLGGCTTIKKINAPKGGSGSADYSVYVAMGTSISAGWESGGLVDRHQRQAFPVLFAAIARSATFDVPWVGGDGLPALSRLVSLGPPLIITNAGRVNGSATNSGLLTAYHNMAVPYSLLVDVADTTRYQIGPPTFPQYRSVMFTTIQRGRGTLLAQVATQINPSPTFITFEYGSNEVLGPASRGSGTIQPDPATYAFLLNQTLNGLQALLPNVKCALFTVPDVTTIPLVRTIPAVQLGANGLPVAPIAPLLGPGNTPMNPLQDYVLLTAGPLLAAGYGYPTGTTSYMSGTPVPGNGIGLPDSVVLSASEVTSVKAAVTGYNTAIINEATNRGFALVDLKGLLDTARSSGFDIQGTRYTSAFLTGGLFSLDGAHPSDLAHGLICNTLIGAVNGKFGSSIPPVNLAASQTTRADRASRVLREGGSVAPAVFQIESGLSGMFPWRDAEAP
jgi:hypothetical protein